jgi:MFS family permease
MEPKKVALMIAVLAGFLTLFDLSAVNITLPTFASEFSMDVVTLGWVATAYLLASAVFLVPFGRIADIHRRKKIFSAGLIVFTEQGECVHLYIQNMNGLTLTCG